MELKSDSEDLDLTFYDACKKGDIKTIKKMVKNGYNSGDYGLGIACKKCHEKVVTYLIDKGASDFYSAFLHACSGGSREIVDIILRRSPHWITNYDQDAWQYGLNNASRWGHLPIVKMMVGKGATDYNAALKLAWQGHHKEIMIYLIQKGADNFDNILSYPETKEELIDMITKKQFDYRHRFRYVNNIEKLYTELETKEARIELKDIMIDDLTNIVTQYL